VPSQYARNRAGVSGDQVWIVPIDGVPVLQKQKQASFEPKAGYCNALIIH